MILAILLMVAAPAEDALDCTRDDLAQQELNICAAQDFEEADKALNAQWKLTVAEMKEWDVDGSGVYDDGRPGFYATMLDGQRAWLAFRDANCKVYGYQMRGGSAEPMMISGCMATMTKARTQELRDLIETR